MNELAQSSLSQSLFSFYLNYLFFVFFSRSLSLVFVFSSSLFKKSTIRWKVTNYNCKQFFSPTHSVVRAIFAFYVRALRAHLTFNVKVSVFVHWMSQCEMKIFFAFFSCHFFLLVVWLAEHFNIKCEIIIELCTQSGSSSQHTEKSGFWRIANGIR